MSEVKETVYITIALILIAAVLQIGSVFMGMRNDLAEIANKEVASERTVNQLRQFNKYDNKEVYGSDIIELIRLYYNSGIEIYINSCTGFADDIVINSKTAKENPSIVKLETLTNMFKSTMVYKAQTAYDGNNPKNISTPMKTVIGSEVTGISLWWISD